MKIPNSGYGKKVKVIISLTQLNETLMNKLAEKSSFYVVTVDHTDGNTYHNLLSSNYEDTIEAQFTWSDEETISNIKCKTIGDLNQVLDAKFDVIDSKDSLVLTLGDKNTQANISINLSEYLEKSKGYPIYVDNYTPATSSTGGTGGTGTILTRPHPIAK